MEFAEVCKETLVLDEENFWNFHPLAKLLAPILTNHITMQVLWRVLLDFSVKAQRTKFCSPPLKLLESFVLSTDGHSVKRPLICGSCPWSHFFPKSFEGTQRSSLGCIRSSSNGQQRLVKRLVGCAHGLNPQKQDRTLLHDLHDLTRSYHTCTLHITKIPTSHSMD